MMPCVMNPTGTIMLIESVPSLSHSFLIAPAGGDQTSTQCTGLWGTLYSIKPHVSQWLLSLICPMGANFQMGTHGVRIYVARIVQVLLYSWMTTLNWWVNSRVWAVVWARPRKTSIHIPAPHTLVASVKYIVLCTACEVGVTFLI